MILTAMPEFLSGGHLHPASRKLRVPWRTTEVPEAFLVLARLHLPQLPLQSSRPSPWPTWGTKAALLARQGFCCLLRENLYVRESPED